VADENSDLTLRILREVHAKLAEIQTKLTEHDRRFDIVDAKFGRLEVDVRDLRATANKHSVLLEAVIESIAQL
jgi:hypothetical protein